MEFKDSLNTKRATKASIVIFEDYVKAKSLNFPQNSEDLADVLKYFYAEARRADGAPYTKNSL
jgi:hypothetical protein